MKKHFLFMFVLSIFFFSFVCCSTGTDDVSVTVNLGNQQIIKPSNQKPGNDKNPDKETAKDETQNKDDTKVPPKKPSKPEEPPVDNKDEGTVKPNETKPNPDNKDEVNPPIPDIDNTEEVNPPVDTNPDSSSDNKDDVITPEQNPETGEGSGGESTEDGSGIKPFPGAITDNSILKLKLNLDNKVDDGNMYLMLRFMGVSENGAWKQVYDEKTSKEQLVYPRGFVLGYIDVNGQYAEQHLNGYDGSGEPLPGVGYTKEYGFNSDGNGNYLVTKFYFGDENMHCKISGKNDLNFQFQNFVIVDSLVQGELMGNPDFVRYPSGYPLKINIPMKDYNPNIHKNIAYITIYFEPDKGTTDDMFPYQAVLDGFEPR